MPGRENKQQLFERMERLACDWMTIRTWREMTFEQMQSGSYCVQSRAEIEAVVYNERHKDYASIAQALLELPHMNAVEVLDPDGNGLVVYADWP